jgi:hypothetical protein
MSVGSGRKQWAYLKSEGNTRFRHYLSNKITASNLLLLVVLSLRYFLKKA